MHSYQQLQMNNGHFSLQKGRQTSESLQEVHQSTLYLGERGFAKKETLNSASLNSVTCINIVVQAFLHITAYLT